jgi:hypothetical protein
MHRHGCQRLVISILAELRDLDGQSRGVSSETARDDKRQRTAAAPTRTLQPAVSGGVHHAPAVETRPGGMSTATHTARLMPDKHGARPQGVTVGAALRWPRHP